MKEEWVTDIKNKCQAADVAFFFKQWGGNNKKKQVVCWKVKPGTICLKLNCIRACRNSTLNKQKLILYSSKLN
ncbi:MAG: DUF5131 family protein [Cyclobacteriaceae bacterium]